jgi:mersacidin/lichenicidin family type 2 lantibiotic
MTREQIIRAWRNPEYRRGLSPTERELLPAHPAGRIELSDDELLVVAGGLRAEGTEQFCTTPCTMPAICPGSAACCWIAAVVYGEDFFLGPRVNLVRRWLINDYEKTAIGKHVVGLYRVYGERVANVVKKSELLRRSFRMVFDFALNKAEAKYGSV